MRTAFFRFNCTSYFGLYLLSSRGGVTVSVFFSVVTVPSGLRVVSVFALALPPPMEKSEKCT